MSGMADYLYDIERIKTQMCSLEQDRQALIGENHNLKETIETQRIRIKKLKEKLKEKQNNEPKQPSNHIPLGG